MSVAFERMKKYIFKPYNSFFPRLFEREKSRIAAQIGPNIIMEHVGSTAIPKMGGKGIIDIAIAVNLDEIERVSKILQDLGYLFRESWSVPERWFFRADLSDEVEGTRRYHVHLTVAESDEWKNLLLFRDYLRSHPEDANTYAELKKEAAEQFNEDGSAYRKKKAPFFMDILERARRKG